MASHAANRWVQRVGGLVFFSFGARVYAWLIFPFSDLISFFPFIARVVCAGATA
jgi:hypothetical protein